MNNILSSRLVGGRQSNQELTFRRAEISFFIHATEDGKKLLEGISMRLDVPMEMFEHKKGEGHFGNPIQITKVHLGHAESEALVKNIVRGLGIGERVILAKEVDSHLDADGNLYLRLDKQELILGKLILGAKDPIRIKVKINSSSRGRGFIVLACQRLLLE